MYLGVNGGGMKKAIVFLSGGVDSTTCLAIAQSQGYACYALTFDYGQRHHIEIEYAKKIAQSMGVVEHRVFKLDINQWHGSALTDSHLQIPHHHGDEIPITYVPARNTIFLSLALGWAEVLGSYDIFFGPNKNDFIHYPDCRPEYIQAFEHMARFATLSGVEGHNMTIHTPLMALDKSQIIQTGLALGVDYVQTFSCYDPTPQGKPCGLCLACSVRHAAFAQIKNSI